MMEEAGGTELWRQIKGVKYVELGCAAIKDGERACEQPPQGRGAGPSWREPDEWNKGKPAARKEQVAGGEGGAQGVRGLNSSWKKERSQPPALPTRYFGNGKFRNHFQKDFFC